MMRCDEQKQLAVQYCTQLLAFTVGRARACLTVSAVHRISVTMRENRAWVLLGHPVYLPAHPTVLRCTVDNFAHTVLLYHQAL